MWPFDRRPKIRTSDFIERETSKVFAPSYADSLREIFYQAGFHDVADVDIVAFRFWMTIAGASFAKIPDNVQRGLWHRVYEEAERRHGRTWRATLEEAIIEYFRLTSKDMDRTSSNQFLPETMTFALNRLVGKSDESVVALRVALLTIVHGIIKSETAFFRDIRLVS